MEAESAGVSLRASLNLLRRLDPGEVCTNLAALSALRPDLAPALSSLVDRPSTRAWDAAVNKQYLASEYNRGEGESYRSPHTNTWAGGCGAAGAASEEGRGAAASAAVAPRNTTLGWETTTKAARKGRAG